MSTPNVGSSPASDLLAGSDTEVPAYSAVHSTAAVDGHQSACSGTEFEQLAVISDLIGRISAAPSAEVAARILANELKTYFDCREVVIGIQRRENRSCETFAVSGRDRIDPKSEHACAAAAVLEESVVREENGFWPVRDSGNRHALLAHRRFCEQIRAHEIMSASLTDDAANRNCAAIIVSDHTIEDRVITFLRAAERPIASSIGLQMRSDGNRFDRLANRFKAFVFKRKSKLAIAAIATALLILMCPVRYRIACKCELQPVVRRYVAAPFDGPLEKNFAEPGDVVAAGDVLARIDARDIEWDLSGKRAELHRVMKERAGYLASHESGKVELAGLEVERLSLEIEQLEHHAANLEICSPIAGIVIVGDLSKSEGVPLEKGAPLFEIAPLDQMIVEVWIPEDDVRFVMTGMKARVCLDSFPLNGRDTTVSRIHPRAELKEHENVFVAESTLDNANGELRPGMHGDAKIESVPRTLGWVLFHKSFAATVAWFGW